MGNQRAGGCKSIDLSPLMLLYVLAWIKRADDTLLDREQLYVTETLLTRTVEDVLLGLDLEQAWVGTLSLFGGSYWRPLRPIMVVNKGLWGGQWAVPYLQVPWRIRASSAMCPLFCRLFPPECRTISGQFALNWACGPRRNNNDVSGVKDGTCVITDGIH